jgi:DnaJ-class molecular chaperone
MRDKEIIIRIKCEMCDGTGCLHHDECPQCDGKGEDNLVENWAVEDE